ncbi:MAG TPA: hypothetical protein PLK35_00175 [Candidatus Moranbacteria bacterium]|nr:hypothetical protein [Candidatus Moranbacteria bacterium]
MNLFVHLLIHILFGLLAGFIVWRIWKKIILSFFSALLSGVAVDFDHLIDYFLVFGADFRLDYFINGYSFLKSDKIYVLFHGWEYVIIGAALALILENKTAKTIFLALSLGLFFHLSADVFIDNLPVKSYSLLYRAKNNFDSQKLLYPDHWQKHLRQKGELILIKE